VFQLPLVNVTLDGLTVPSAVFELLSPIVTFAVGCAQLVNHFEVESAVSGSASFDRWYLVDLPGYGFAKVSQRDRNRWEQMIEHYLKERENLAMVFVLIDARHSPQKIDLAFLEKLKKWQVPVSIVFTKSDKENQRTVAKNIKDFFEAIKATWQFLPSYVVTSAVKKTGKEKLLSLINEMMADQASEDHR
ncbi:MAG TPA: ribosome biogenesis GTP-binding protein YihA/YsxC, partial [Ferruginibacter sp.]|nr:ribosome biogenesis GTP-binding protein YihA/YsxC [Ferruginibacter sp.]